MSTPPNKIPVIDDVALERRRTQNRNAQRRSRSRRMFQHAVLASQTGAAPGTLELGHPSMTASMDVASIEAYTRAMDYSGIGATHRMFADALESAAGRHSTLDYNPWPMYDPRADRERTERSHSLSHSDSRRSPSFLEPAQPMSRGSVMDFHSPMLVTEQRIAQLVAMSRELGFADFDAAVVAYYTSTFTEQELARIQHDSKKHRLCDVITELQDCLLAHYAETDAAMSGQGGSKSPPSLR